MRIREMETMAELKVKQPQYFGHVFKQVPAKSGKNNNYEFCELKMLSCFTSQSLPVQQF